MFPIRKSPTELTDEKQPRWDFLFTSTLEAHAEWGLFKILKCMGLNEILPWHQGRDKTEPNLKRK